MKKLYNWTIKKYWPPHTILGNIKAVDSTIALELARKKFGHNVFVETFEITYVPPNVQPAEITIKLK